MPPPAPPRKRAATARETIIRRRARFVALAVASSGALGAGAACVCLSVEPAPPVPTPSAEEPTTVVADPSAPDNAPGDAGALLPPDAERLPQATPPVRDPQDAGFLLCLSVDEVEPAPSVCLRAPDEDLPG